MKHFFSVGFLKEKETSEYSCFQGSFPPQHPSRTGDDCRS